MWFWDLLGNILGYGIAFIIFVLWPAGKFLIWMSNVKERREVDEKTKRGNEVLAPENHTDLVVEQGYSYKITLVCRQSVPEYLKKKPYETMYSFPVSAMSLSWCETIEEAISKSVQSLYYANVDKALFIDNHEAKGKIIPLLIFCSNKPGAEVEYVKRDTQVKYKRRSATIEEIVIGAFEELVRRSA